MKTSETAPGEPTLADKIRERAKATKEMIGTAPPDVNSTIEWFYSQEPWDDKPVDEDGIYDPTKRLDFNCFAKLGLDEQVDYILYAAWETMRNWGLEMAHWGLDLPGGGKILVVLKQDCIHPRKPFVRPERMYGVSSKKTPYMEKFEPVQVRIHDPAGWHDVQVHSALYRTVVIGLMLGFLVQFHPTGWAEFAEAASYYTSALLLGNGRAPMKYRTRV